MDIDGKAAIVTGGASGLGAATARMLANKGAKVSIFDQNEELAELRADTSIEKQEMANENRMKLARMKPKTNGRSN